MQKAVAERWEKLTGHYLLEGYGLTECSPLVSVNPYDINCHTGSIGLPVPSTDVIILDENGNEVPTGEPGELCIRGPQVMLGYWQHPEATAEVLKMAGSTAAILLPLITKDLSASLTAKGYDSGFGLQRLS